MTPRIPENISTWLVDWRLVTIVENVPPRDPNDDDEDEEDEEDEDRHEEPAKYDTRRLGGGNKAQRFRRAELTGFPSRNAIPHRIWKIETKSRVIR